MIDQHTALIVVDEQNDFMPGGALAVTDGQEVVYPTNILIYMTALRKGQVVLTADWHERYGNVHFKEKGGPWPVHCVAGTEGAGFHENLFAKLADVFIHKGTDAKDDGYSGFEGKTINHHSIHGGERIMAKATENEDLNKSLSVYLTSKDITRVLICGLATDYCVKATALDSIKAGFPTYLVWDACRAVENKTGDEAFMEMLKAGITVTNTMEILRAIIPA